MTTAHNPQTTGKNTESRNEVRGTSNEEWKGKSHKSQVTSQKRHTTSCRSLIKELKQLIAIWLIAHGTGGHRSHQTAKGEEGRGAWDHGVKLT